MNAPSTERAPRFPDLPHRMRRLPVDKRGFPVPWFVSWEDGVPDFRMIGRGKMGRAHRDRLCWLCGEEIESINAFVIGPMCVINRVSSEPPSHLDCARFAAMRCPFLANAKARRNEKNMHPERIEPAGMHSPDNPGATAIYICRRYAPVLVSGHGVGRAGTLFNLGQPTRIEWYAEGKLATRTQVEAALAKGIPKLEAAAKIDPDPELAMFELNRMIDRARTLLPV